MDKLEFTDWSQAQIKIFEWLAKLLVNSLPFWLEFDNISVWMKSCIIAVIAELDNIVLFAAENNDLQQ